MAIKMANDRLRSDALGWLNKGQPLPQASDPDIQPLDPELTHRLALYHSSKSFQAAVQYMCHNGSYNRSRSIVLLLRHILHTHTHTHTRFTDQTFIDGSVLWKGTLPSRERCAMISKALQKRL